MIIEGHGNILDSDATMIVIPINTLGVPGRGLALQAVERWPLLLGRESPYWHHCKAKILVGGSFFFLGFGDETMDGRQQVWGACTKEDWRRPSRYEWITDCAENIRQQIIIEARSGETSIAIPPLGCGLGGLDWVRVRGILGGLLAFVPHVEVRFHGPGEFS